MTRDKLVTVHYGLDELPRGALASPRPRRPGSRRTSPLVLAVGRLIEQKDHATLLRAFARVRREASGRAARDPRQRPARGRAPERWSAELGLGDAVIAARQDEIRDWLERADVFVHTSRWEGFGIVLLEAMLACAARRRDARQRRAGGRRRRRDRPRSSRRATRGRCARRSSALLGDPERARRLGDGGAGARAAPSSRSRGWSSGRSRSTARSDPPSAQPQQQRRHRGREDDR